MNGRAVLLADGSSDAPLGQHVARIARRHGCDLDVVAPDLARLKDPPGLEIASRLQTVLEFDDTFDLVVVHRDAEGSEFDVRCEEIRQGVAQVRQDLPFLPVVPIKMTEAWLLVDEPSIRFAAGCPDGKQALDLPRPKDVEGVNDPKRVLQRALIRASGAQGRRLGAFKRDFGNQRRRLLEWLDHTGPVAELPAWKELERSVQHAVEALRR